MRAFTAVQAARITGCSISQLRYWDRVGLVRPSEPPGPPSGSGQRYDFGDLVALRTVRALLDAGLPLRRIRRAAEYLAEEGEDLRDLRLVTDGSTVLACRSDGEVLDALRGGQLALFVAVGAVADEIEAEVAAFSSERDAFVGALADPDPEPGAESG